MTPAIKLAEQGIIVTPDLYTSLQSAKERLQNGIAVSQYSLKMAVNQTTKSVINSFKPISQTP